MGWRISSAPAQTPQEHVHSSAHSNIKVSYAALSDGAEITFSTADRHLLTAIHRWSAHSYPSTAPMPGPSKQATAMRVSPRH